jgi:hypothetical protein
MLVYNPKELPGVTTGRPEVLGVLHLACYGYPFSSGEKLKTLTDHRSGPNYVACDATKKKLKTSGRST